MKISHHFLAVTTGVIGMLSQPLLAQDGLAAAECVVPAPVSIDLIGGIDPHYQPQDESETASRGYLTFFLDNDLFGGTDENYFGASGIRRRSNTVMALH